MHGQRPAPLAARVSAGVAVEHPGPTMGRRPQCGHQHRRQRRADDDDGARIEPAQQPPRTQRLPCVTHRTEQPALCQAPAVDEARASSQGCRQACRAWLKGGPAQHHRWRVAHFDAPLPLASRLRRGGRRIPTATSDPACRSISAVRRASPKRVRPAVATRIARSVEPARLRARELTSGEGAAMTFSSSASPARGASSPGPSTNACWPPSIAAAARP